MHTLNIVSAARPKSSQARERTGQETRDERAWRVPPQAQVVRGLTLTARARLEGPALTTPHERLGLLLRLPLDAVGRGTLGSLAAVLRGPRTEPGPGPGSGSGPDSGPNAQTRRSSSDSRVNGHQLTPVRPPPPSCTQLHRTDCGVRKGGGGGVGAFDLGCGQVTFRPTAFLGKAYAGQGPLALSPPALWTPPRRQWGPTYERGDGERREDPGVRREGTREITYAPTPWGASQGGGGAGEGKGPSVPGGKDRDRIEQDRRSTPHRR